MTMKWLSVRRATACEQVTEHYVMHPNGFTLAKLDLQLQAYIQMCISITSEHVGGLLQ